VFNKILFIMLSAASGRQHRGCVISEAVNTVYCSWRRAKSSSETCWADWNY